MPWVIVAGTFALFQGALLLLFGWEQRRFLLNRARTPLAAGPLPAVRLVIPCRGVDPQMELNLRALFQLDYADLELCFVVESLQDSAVALIRMLQSVHLLPCRIVEAGLAVDCGQKVHNLIAACRLPRGDRDVLAFVDSDARPHRDWLARLVQRLESGKYAVATGYRWYLPSAGQAPGTLISAINNTVVGILGPHGFNLVWGGAWAVRWEAFEQMGFPDAWRGGLSDDLLVSRQVHGLRLKLAYEPHALVVSPAVFTWRSACEFLRRQFLVVHNCAPDWWRFAFWAGLGTQATWWILVALTILGIGAQPQRLLPAALTALVYALGVLRWAWALSAVRPFVRATDADFWGVARCNIWAWPLVSLVTWVAVASAAVGRTIQWRGITYSMEAPNRTRVIRREHGALPSGPAEPALDTRTTPAPRRRAA